MDFQAGDRGELQSFIKQLTDALQMIEDRLGIVIPFAAVRQVAAERERVMHTSAFRTRLLNETKRERLERGALALMNLEIGSNGAAGVGREHGLRRWFQQRT